MIDEEKAAALRKKIGTILAQLSDKGAIYCYANGEDIVIDFREKPRVLSLDLAADVALADEQLSLLRMLHDAEDADGKRLVIEELGAAFAGLRGRLLLFLAKFGGIPAALTAFKNKVFVDVAADVITPIAYLLCCDSSWMSATDLDALCTELRELARQTRKDFPEPPAPPSSHGVFMPPPGEEYMRARRRAYASERFEYFVTYICGQVAAIHYMRLKKELEENSNFEINQDRDRLAESLERYGFSAKLIEFLHFAEREFHKANDEFSYNTCVDQIRSFFTELLNETADKIAASLGITLDAEGVDRTRPADVRKYLLTVGFFSEQFKLLSDGLYRFMSDEGTHTLGSTKDVARLARNLAIEIGLLITKRLAEWR